MISFLVERDHPQLSPNGVEWLVHGAPLNESDPRYTLSPDQLRLTVSKVMKGDEGLYNLSARNAAGVGRAVLLLDVQCKEERKRER